MKKALKIPGIILLIAIIGLSVGGCEQPTGSKVSVRGVSLSETYLALTVGETETLSAIIEPENAANKNITWTTSNPVIAAVDDTGTVSAQAVGTATIVVTTVDGDKKASCTVRVSAAPLTGTVSISGTPAVGQTLTAVTDSLGGTGTMSYQWKRADTASGAPTNITPNGTGGAYTPVSADEGKYITVTVTRTGYTGSVSSDPTTAVAPADIPALTGTVSINGTPAVGQRLTANTNNLSGTGDISYQWKRGDTDIGADSNAYTVQAADMGSTITVTVTRIGYSGSVSSGAVTVNDKVNAQTPDITGQPVDAAVTINAPHSLSVTASSPDEGTLSYQWYRNTGASNSGGTAINGAAYSSYTPPTGTAGTYYYFVEITNTISNNGDGGNKTATARSDAVTLTVNDKINAQTPSITGQPTGGTVLFGGMHSLSVTANASDGGTLSYQWYRNTGASNSGGTAMSGAVSSTYNPPTDTAGTFYYFVEITNTIDDNGDGGVKTATVRSNAVSLMVNAQVNAQTPIITSQPTSATITINHSHTLSVTASRGDSGTLSYQWYSNTGASNSGGTIIPGAVSSTYIPPTGTEGTCYYFVEVINTILDNGDGGNKIATIKSNVATLTVNNLVNAEDPNIITQPIGGTVLFGGTYSLSVTASSPDGGTLSYQWYRNTGASNSGGTIISGAASSTYNPPTGTAGIFYYFVEVTNTISNNGDGGVKTASVRSNAAMVTVNDRVNAQSPVITSQPIGGTVAFGGTYSISVTANSSDGGTLSYQWYSNTSATNSGGAVITGATSATYIPPTGTAGIFYYFVEITNTISNNGDGGVKTASVRSDAVTVTVNTAVNFSITFANFSDINEPTMSAGIIYLIGGAGRPTSATITVSNPQQYETGSIRWYLNNSLIGTGGTLTVNSGAYNNIGHYSVTVEVKKDGKLYSKIVTFEVRP